MLILFDIDGTLINTTGMGMRGLTRALRGLYGEAFRTEGVEYSGRLDPLIVADLLTVNGIAPDDAALARIRDAYTNALSAMREEIASEGCVLPGVVELLDALDPTPATLGLLTGNFPETGRIKLEACGLSPEGFEVKVWGDACRLTPPSRDELPRVAMSGWRPAEGLTADPASVLVIGDTPHDVRCARINGCRSLAVATGRYAAEELEQTGADLVVGDLSATEEILAWILDPTRAAPQR